jgi:hypothetical protein
MLKFHLDKYGTITAIDYSTPKGRTCDATTSTSTAKLAGGASFRSAAYAEFQQDAVAIPLRVAQPGAQPGMPAPPGGAKEVDADGNEKKAEPPQSFFRKYWCVCGHDVCMCVYVRVFVRVCVCETNKFARRTTSPALRYT